MRHLKATLDISRLFLLYSLPPFLLRSKRMRGRGRGGRSLQSIFTFVVVQLLSHGQLFATPWTAALPATLELIQVGTWRPLCSERASFTFETGHQQERETTLQWPWGETEFAHPRCSQCPQGRGAADELSREGQWAQKWGGTSETPRRRGQSWTRDRH